MIARFYVGIGKDRDGNELDTLFVQARRRAVTRRLASSYGGVTVQQASGAWVDPDGLLVEEDVLVFIVGGTLHESEVGALATWLADVFRQTSVATELNQTELQFS